MPLNLIAGVDLARAHAMKIPKHRRAEWFRALRDYIITRFISIGTMPPQDLPTVLWYIDALEKELT